MHLSRRQAIRAGLSAMALAVAPLASCASKGERGETLQTTFFCFDTVCSVGGSLTQGVLDGVVALCEECEQLFSRTLATSDVGRINAAGSTPTQVDPRTIDLIEAALGYSEASDGLFDITIGAVSELWDFHEGVVPSDEALAAALPHVGWRGVEVDRAASTVRLADPDARIDLGGIAKGYVTDAVIDYLTTAGVTSAYVNLGGNVAVLGPKSDGTPWGIGVRDPFGGDAERSVALVHAEGGSVVTSGLYERQFERDGVRYWHILDPRTGRPVPSDIVSASLYTERSIDGDGYTKPLFMLGKDAALAFLEERGIDGLLISEEGGLHTTAGSAFEQMP